MGDADGATTNAQGRSTGAPKQMEGGTPDEKKTVAQADESIGHSATTPANADEA